MESHKFELLFPQDKISRRITELGRQISADYGDKKPILIGVLKGCVIFIADLIRTITIPVELEFISASSYNNGQTASERVDMGRNPNKRLAGRHLLLVDGVVDSGKTIASITKKLELEKPASIEVVTLLDKPKCRKVDAQIKYVGFDAGEDFVIGYGLDVDQDYRKLPFVGKVTE